MSRGLATSLRLAVGIVALTILVRRVDLSLAWQTLRTAEPAWLAGALAAQLGSKMFWIERWGVLLASKGYPRPFLERLRLVLVGLFFNNFLPTSVGGDVVRGLALSRRGVPRATSAATVIADRVIGVLALAILAVGGGVVGWLRWPDDGPWTAAGLFALAMALGIVVVTRPQALERLASGTRFAFSAKISAKLRRLIDAMAHLEGARRSVLTALALSLGLAACSALYHWTIGRSIGIDVPLVAYFVIVPAVMLFASLPITLNGLGLRELGFVGFLGAQGVPGSTAAVFALLAFVGPLLFALAGGLVFLSGRDVGPRAVEGEAT